MLRVMKSKRIRICCIFFLCSILIASLLCCVIVPLMCSHELYIHTEVGSLLGYSNLAYVKFKNKTKNVFSYYRTAFTFEVMEWLNGGNEEKIIRVYSTPYLGECYKSQSDFYEECYGYRYENDKNYIIAVGEDSDNEYILACHVYVPLYDMGRSNALSSLTFRNGTIKATDLAPADLIFFIKEYYANKANGDESRY